MILIDAIYINSSGGKVLLEYLIDSILTKKFESKCFFLLDNRLKSESLSKIPKDNILIMSPGEVNRMRFYRSISDDFSTVLCFGNVPPPVRLPIRVLTYFHMRLFLSVPQGMGVLTKLKIHIKSLVIHLRKRNTDVWFVQSLLIKQLLIKRYRIPSSEAVKILPFFDLSKFDGRAERVSNRFIYVSTGEIHKNHIRLIQAFCNFYDKRRIGEMHLTVDKKYKEVCSLVDLCRAKGYPIVNHGFVDVKILSELYRSSEFSIYPSLTESFGLGIVEAIYCGCKIIGSDRAYMHAVCVPSLAFDPESVKEITRALETASSCNLNHSISLVNNEIESLINYLR